MGGVWITCYVTISGLSGVVAHATEDDARARQEQHPDEGLDAVFLPFGQDLWSVLQ